MRLWNKHLFSTVFIVLLDVCPKVVGQGPTYVVTGVHGRSWSSRISPLVRYFDGVFQKIKDGDYYVQLGFRSDHYIYPINQDKTAYWVLGRSEVLGRSYRNRTYEDAAAVFKSKGNQQNGPNLSNWFQVYDGSHKGESLVPKNNADRIHLKNQEVPSLRVFRIEDNISETELLRKDGVEIKGGVLCNSQQNQQWLFLEGAGQKICSARVRSGTKCQCKNCWDGTLCKEVHEISTELVLQEKKFDHKLGLFCEDQNKEQ